MWKNALNATAAIMFCLSVYVFTSVDYLIPYKWVLWYRYRDPILIYAALLAFNIFFLYLWLARVLLHKDTGEKLKKFERQQLHEGDIDQDLSDYLNAKERV